MLPTPSTSHVLYDRIYEPAEDSYLLLDTLSSENESAFLRERFRNGSSPLVCEVGTGSGVVLAFVTAQSQIILGRTDMVVLGTDINRFACQAAWQTVDQAQREARPDTSATISLSNTQSLAILNADLAAPLRKHALDILIFNPPYVPAPLPDLTKHEVHNTYNPAMSDQEAFDRDSHLLSLSYAGGEDGMEVTNKLLDQLPDVLDPVRGVAYVLLCAQNKPKEVIDRIERWPGSWQASIVGSSGMKAGWEKLVIVRIRPCS